MGKSVKKPVIGILGGIGSGKSSVTNEFAKLGCKVIDADKIAHKILDEKNIKEKVAEIFGKEILDSSGQIERIKLAEAAFGSKEKLDKLNSIIHPPVLAKIELLIEKYQQQPKTRAIVLDVPLLIEIGWHKRCDKLVFVDCKKSLRLNRIKTSRNLDEKQVKIREKFQISLDNKVAIADNTVDNNAGLPALARQITDIFSRIINNS
ncbi:MAG: dephospho-CoA kinase [Planctomycetes bacterium]|nr:dephospho-CoA kinase [Planctomycetota bacterium]